MKHDTFREQSITVFLKIAYLLCLDNTLETSNIGAFKIAHLCLKSIKIHLSLQHICGKCGSWMTNMKSKCLPSHSAILMTKFSFVLGVMRLYVNVTSRQCKLKNYPSSRVPYLILIQSLWSGTTKPPKKWKNLDKYICICLLFIYSKK